MADLSAETKIDLAELNVVDLEIQRGPKTLFDNLSFTAKAGDLIWVTGANGSGKTSLLKCLAGLLGQNSGQVTSNATIAYLGHNDAHKANLTVRENLEFWHSIHGSNADLESSMGRVDILHLADLEAKKLSAGQSRRGALARLLLKPAKLWLLDEPAAPMDVEGRAIITDLIEQHLFDGGMALIATHTIPYKIGTNAQVLNLGGHTDG